MPTPAFQGMMAVTVHVNDIERARRFYTQVLGLREIRFENEPKRATFEVPGSNVPLAVHPFEGECKRNGGRPPGTVTGIVFTVPDLQRGIQDLEKRGVTITDRTLYGGIVASIADPDGNEFLIGTK